MDHPRGELWFRERLVELGYGDRTVVEYVRAWQRMADHVDLDTCSPLQFKRALDSHIPNTWASRKLLHSALKAYWQATGRLDNSTHSHGPAPIRVIRVPKKPRFQCRAISFDDARRLAATAMAWDQGAEGLAVLFGLYAALRRAEIAALTWESIEDDGWLTLTGKWDVTDSIPLHSAITDRLEWWRGFEVDDLTDMRTRPGQAYLFSGHQGRPHVTPSTVWQWTRKVACEAGVPDLTTHQLRHTALATINDLTGDLRVTQQIARHSDPSTTVLYTRVTRSRMRGAVDGLQY